jgi:hypothetical protein
VQPRGIVFLDDEAQPLRRGNLVFPAGLGGLAEIAFGLVSRQFFGGHGGTVPRFEPVDNARFPKNVQSRLWCLRLAKSDKTV